MFRKIFFIIVPITISGCFNPHHVFDVFHYEKEALKKPEVGVVFYDWWRSQPGLTVINDTDKGKCRVHHALGFLLGEWPGLFCTIVSGDKYFSVDKVSALRAEDGKILWHLAEGLQIYDVGYDSQRDWIWMITRTSDTFQVSAFSVSDGHEVLSLRVSEGVKSHFVRWKSEQKSILLAVDQTLYELRVSERPLVSKKMDLGPWAYQELENGNYFFIGQSITEFTPEGRLAWQFNPPLSALQSRPWIRRVSESQARVYLDRFKEKR